jgi:hypothetical protein
LQAYRNDSNTFALRDYRRSIEKRKMAFTYTEVEIMKTDNPDIRYLADCEILDFFTVSGPHCVTEISSHVTLFVQNNGLFQQSFCNFPQTFHFFVAW